ncbi:aspartyl-phosphate phosphatase Spo0E family protein [Lysinibacillus sp. SGAir0095]|uniref:aspartyl-phosphate phosphatase Spo0E family protein n=1 Tax=Lysinibacillus sp. SGAir0095 TaxID=2070463 RepID=UPI0010CD296E|nr:aspartyl-phosphate phosphatase Spo0E family protein [Lysinibacillus sp. SGAir0095]QCR31907.1 Spo0E family sporulation regulatory protein-aspartic acid phosphatase [Lysinibacillus sp. SGAir0095]
MASTLKCCHNIDKIQILRTELIKSGMDYGLDHPTTIKISQTLDKLLNECLVGCNSAIRTN